jgi:arabinan endo-1,5-alpha-L-arabinosidase
MKTKKSFTLVELMVVLAIISILSAIIFVNVSGSTTRARLAKAMEFSQTVNRTLGAYAVGIWRFEDSGSVVFDNSGHDNNGTAFGGIYATGTVGNGMEFNGNAYIDAGNDSSLNMDLDDDFTIELWAKSNGYVGGGGLVAKGSWSDKGYFIAYNYGPQCVYFGLYDTTGYEGKTIQTNLCGAFGWSHIVAVKKGNNIEAWVNAVKIGGVNNMALTSLANNLHFFIGKSSENAYFNGTIDEVRIYNQALETAAIEKSYAQGLLRHLSLK